MNFKIHKIVHGVSLRKSLHKIFLVLPYPFDRVGSNAHVQRAVSLTGEDIDTRLLQCSVRAFSAGKISLHASPVHGSPIGVGDDVTLGSGRRRRFITVITFALGRSHK